jgi:hypothetical protein
MLQTSRLALVLLLAPACGLFPESDSEPNTTTSAGGTTLDDPTTTGPAIDPDPDSIPPAPIVGERGNSSFGYGCVGGRDPACLGLTNNKFPALIAVGGQFLLDYMPGGGGVRQPESASEERITYFGLYQALVAGDTAMFVHGTQDGKPFLLDFTTLHVATPSEVVLQRNDLAVQAIFLAPADEITVSAHTRDAHKVVLAGTLEFTWTLADADIAVITATTGGGVRLRGLASGTTTLTASLGELSASVALTVEGGPELTTGGTSSTGDTDSTGAST